MAKTDLIPDHLRRSLETWYGALLVHQRGTGMDFEPGPPRPREDLLQRLERVLGIRLSWEGPDPGRAAVADLLTRAVKDDTFALKLIEALLVIEPNEHNANRLAEILDSPGSRWEVSGLDGISYPGEFHLVLRGSGPIRELISVTATYSEAANRHLGTAWQKLTQQPSEPRAAMHEAVMAVEAAAGPVVIPNDGEPTIGKIASEMKMHPARLETVLPMEEVKDVQRRAEILRRAEEKYRHGAPEGKAPSQEEARAVLSLAVELTNYFLDGSVRRA